MNDRNIKLINAFVFRVSSSIDFPGGYLLYLYTGVCVWRVKYKPRNMDSLKILHPKILGSYISLTQKNMGENCVLVINLMARDYF